MNDVQQAIADAPPLKVSRWFDAPQLASEGRSFPVRLAHPPARAGEAFPERGWPFHLRRAVAQALTDSDGDVLAFLPGRREIEQARAAIAGANISLIRGSGANTGQIR